MQKSHPNSWTPEICIAGEGRRRSTIGLCSLCHFQWCWPSHMVFNCNTQPSVKIIWRWSAWNRSCLVCFLSLFDSFQFDNVDESHSEDFGFISFKEFWSVCQTCLFLWFWCRIYAFRTVCTLRLQNSRVFYWLSWHFFFVSFSFLFFLSFLFFPIICKVDHSMMTFNKIEWKTRSDWLPVLSKPVSTKIPLGLTHFQP